MVDYKNEWAILSANALKPAYPSMSFQGEDKRTVSKANQIMQ